MIGYLVAAYGDAELEWLCEDKHEAFAIAREQLDEVESVSIECNEYASKDHFRDEQEKFTRKRARYEAELEYERLEGAA